MVENVPISIVDIGQEEEHLLLEVLRSGRLAQGPMVATLEEEFAETHDVAHAVAVSSGTSALVAAMQAIGVGPGDEVITSPFSFVATLNAILEAGATARFADIGDDFCVDPDSVASLIGLRTKAIMPVHLYGLPADMGKLGPLARSADVHLIEDAAQAHGARFQGRAVGSFGIGCFSLYATKNIMCGEGGVVTTNDPQVADTLRLLRNQGMRARYQYEVAGHNYRLTELQAAIAIPQLRRLSKISDARRANAFTLNDGLKDIEGLKLPVVPEGREHVFHQYTVRVLPEARISRDLLASNLEKRGISSGMYYPRLMHDYECYDGHAGVAADQTPHASQIVSEVLSLPVHQRLSAGQIERIVNAVRESLT